MEKFNLENLGIYFPKNIFHNLDVTTLVFDNTPSLFFKE